MRGEKKGDPLFGKRPVVAVVSSEDSSHTYPSNCVFFYSLQQDQTLFKLEFDTAVVAVACNSQFLAVSTRAGSLHILDAKTLQSVRVIQTYAHSEYGAVFALGQRWLAYQTASPLEDSATAQLPQADPDDLLNRSSGFVGSGASGSGGASGNSSSSASSAAGGGGAIDGPNNQAGSGPWFLGNTSSKDILELTNKGLKKAVYYGTKTVEKLTDATMASLGSAAEQQAVGGVGPSLDGSDTSGGSSDSNKATDRPGLVQVIDLNTMETLAHFKGDSEVLALMSFDPSGSLLLTGRESGQELSVWRISPCGKPLQSHRKLYVLVRGMSLNQVREACWLNDSSLVAFTSRTNGTTHVFPLRLVGGEVSTSSHLSRRA